ncbi:putative thiazole-containing bacteriocin maturation protein [Paenibacillus sp. KN14-4R]|uniref:putative thiazole-containing bacteriocin maturation protein n=1 Tax=Paenibacillus sp. KN14-4R TaxID=3445773 RepID=UPI003F9FCB41
MSNMNVTMRLKVKRDTFYNTDPKGDVYFRNNTSSFRMEGEGIDQWIEKLLPLFDGEHSLMELTDGLPTPYRNQIFDIAETLYRNGFVRDVSQDTAHQLQESILTKYASQIEFLDHFCNSGAYRFQCYRQTKVLAVGSGPFFVSLISALLESGLPKINMLITDAEHTNRQRLSELEEHARKTDSEVTLEEVFLPNVDAFSLSEVVKPFDYILYVSQENELETLRLLHQACREKQKMFLPAVCFQQVGMAGPIVHPDFEGCWESAWRRVHQSVVYNHSHTEVSSSTAEAMLANVIVFESFKKITGVTESEQKHQIFLFDLETLEGKWHPFVPHPLVTERAEVTKMPNIELKFLQSSSKREDGLLTFFSGLTSQQTGIFHIWDEGDLIQIPLAQCRIQVVDPLSEGPAKVLSELVCVDMTHEVARREAGLVGIETYVSRITDPIVQKLLTEQGTGGKAVDQKEFVGVGAGETVAEGVCRGLHQSLNDELLKRLHTQLPSVVPVLLSTIEDERCQFYLKALTTREGEPKIGLGEAVFGFPVVWIGMGDRWFGGIGLNVTQSMRDALQQALFQAQNQSAISKAKVLKVTSINMEEKAPIRLGIPAYDVMSHASEAIQSAWQVLKQNHVQPLVFDLAVEPFLKDELAGVFGVLLQKEENR